MVMNIHMKCAGVRGRTGVYSVWFRTTTSRRDAITWRTATTSSTQRPQYVWVGPDPTWPYLTWPIYNIFFNSDDQWNSQLWFSRLESWSRDVSRLVFQSLGLVFLVPFGHKISVSKWRRTFVGRCQHKALFTSLCSVLIVESLDGDQLYLVQ